MQKGPYDLRCKKILGWGFRPYAHLAQHNMSFKILNTRSSRIGNLASRTMIVDDL
jgi:hypothetical protein